MPYQAYDVKNKGRGNASDNKNISSLFNLKVCCLKEISPQDYVLLLVFLLKLLDHGKKKKYRVSSYFHTFDRLF